MLQSSEIWLCGFKPHFIGTQEHGAEDIAALLRLLGRSDLNATAFRMNRAKHPLLQAGANVKPADTKAAVGPSLSPRADSFASMFTAEQKAIVDAMYSQDFESFGYVPEFSCA